MIPFSDINTAPSYSQAGEDRIVSFLFKRIGYPGNIQYADLGASMPAGDNNTYLFYTLGGNGLLVEADPIYAPAYELIRPNDRVESVAIVPKRMRGQGTIAFHRMQDRGWSTVSSEHKAIGEQLGKASSQGSETVTVPCRTINEVLGAHFLGADIDLLSLDIEGVDLEVLEELDFNRFRPKVVIIEGSINPLNPLLADRVGHFSGYDLFASTYVNSIYVRNEILRKFKP